MVGAAGSDHKIGPILMEDEPSWYNSVPLALVLRASPRARRTRALNDTKYAGLLNDDESDSVRWPMMRRFRSMLQKSP